MTATLRRYRELHKLSQQELGNAVGATRSTIAAWENGRSIASRCIVPICNVLKILPEELLEEELNFGRPIDGISIGKVFCQLEAQRLKILEVQEELSTCLKEVSHSQDLLQGR